MKTGGQDTLTGLRTRAALDEALQQLVSRATDSVALATLDLDYFMAINDRHGQQIGDEVLRCLAAVLEAEAPGHAFRLSGDEFALLLPGTSLEQAFLKMEALRATVERALRTQDLPLEENPLTITVGVAQYPRDAKDASGLVKAAEAALMGAKEGGRNTVGLPPSEEMVMKSCYYPCASVRKLKALAERLGRKESHLLREALVDLVRKYDVVRTA